MLLLPESISLGELVVVVVVDVVVVVVGTCALNGRQNDSLNITEGNTSNNFAFHSHLTTTDAS